MSDEQPNLFDFEEPWKEEWKGMPEYVMRDIEPVKSLVVHFASMDDLRKFATKIEQTVTTETISIWYPDDELITRINKRYVQE